METMRPLFEKSGYAVENIGYPSRRMPVSQLAELVRAKLEGVAKRFDRLHFVTHSMGGILLRQILRSDRIANLGRCVMLAPPSKGSHVVDRLGSWFFFRWLNGPAGCELGTGSNAAPVLLGPVDFEVGVIAGTRSINVILSLMIPGPDDGKVAVSHARLEGQSAFLQVPISHSFIMRNKVVQANALAFLQTGGFLRE
ncbi:hypothetical protein QEH53_06350 [Pelagicoccus sp. SDUM812002]|nr:hypothetical protein [Pelagicoccus sp. SDUM812002]MDQ8185193.1 hypothetical protein [Pelagicoccus sp. SDUM812002]